MPRLISIYVSAWDVFFPHADENNAFLAFYDTANLLTQLLVCLV